MTERYDRLVRGGRLVTGSGIVRGDVAVRDGLVAAVEPEIDPRLARDVIDATGLLVFPGIIDAHNHPYYEDDLEQFSLSAAYGGVTTLLAFAGKPHGVQVPDPVRLVDEFVAEGSARSHIDFGLHVILAPSDDLASLPALAARGVLSFKAFLAFPKQKRMFSDDRLLDLMRATAAVGGICMLHCENGLLTDRLEDEKRRDQATSPADYVASRPPQTESESVYRALSIAELAGCDTYIVHVSVGEAAETIRRFASRPGPRRYAETAPHYLLLERDDQIRMGGLAKISPPMREAADREVLWSSIREGTLDVVASDASGQTCRRKAQGAPNCLDIPYGVPGVEHMFALTYTEAMRRGVPPTALARVFAERPAEIFGLERKGRLRPGFDADLLVFDPEARWVVRAAEQHGNSDYSIFEGLAVQGRPVCSLQRGEPVLRDGRVLTRPGSGRYLPRTPSTRRPAS